MKTHQLESPVVFFEHEEYGRRLLFKNGISNTRDLLGKNGVTTHNGFGSLFYKIIRVRALVGVDESGNGIYRTFNINRNSLSKYLDEAPNNTLFDEVLMLQLQEKLWSTDSNEDGEQKPIQVNAGTYGLRHAGRHNERLISDWRNRFSDFIRGSFLSWLYQKTIGGINRIKIRFLFVSTEKELFEAGEVLAKKRFHEAYENVPAYKTHIQVNGKLVANSHFYDIPLTSKENYIKIQKYDSDTHLYGKYPTISKTDTSTGTTGKPTEWVRGAAELETVKKSLQLAAKIQFGTRRLSYINAFALGPWATGLTTYEIMRNTGSIFATGPDKEKILDKLVSVAKYEKHQLELAVSAFKAKHSRVNQNDEDEIIILIDVVLKTLLKNRDATLDDVLNAAIEDVNEEQTQVVMRKYRSEIKSIAAKLNKEKTQTIIAGYPPFLKDLMDYAQKKGHDFAEFSAIGVVGGQAISEAMRDQLIEHGFNQVYSSYGASDLDINLGVETEYEIVVRKAMEQNPGLARELYGENKGLPMVFHFDPMNHHAECGDEDEVIFTIARNDRSSPRIRYDLGDKGRVYASSDVQALLTKYGIFQKPKTNLPLMFIWGRDSTVVFNGANLAFTELERAVTTDKSLEAIVLKKAFYTYEDDEGVEKLEIWLELNEGIELPEEEEMHALAQDLLNNLVDLNQDFRYQVEKLDDEAVLPMVRFFKRENSPISEAGGHRKQVLVFQKDINLPEGYEFPDEENCQGVCITNTERFENGKGKSIG